MSIIGSVDFEASGDGIDMQLVLNQTIREAEDSLEENVVQAS